jgi:hypothetical protein
MVDSEVPGSRILRILKIAERNESLGISSKRLNSSSTEGPDAISFIGQAHLFVFYIVLSTLIAVCFVVFLSEVFFPKLPKAFIVPLSKYQTV